MEPLDEIDKRIITELKKDCKLTEKQVSELVKISPATAHRRIKKLEEEKVIQRYTIDTDYEKLGKTLLAYVLVRTKPGADYTTMMTDMKKHDEIEDIGAVAGEWDIILKIRATDIKELDNEVFNYLRKFPEITQTQTLIVMRGWK